MEITRDGTAWILELETAPAKKFAGVVLENADGLGSVLLDLANLIRAGQYAAADQFRQPPHAFDEAPPYAPGIKTGGGN